MCRKNKEISNTIAFAIAYQKRKAETALSKAKELEKSFISNGKSWMKANTRTWVLR